MEKEVRPKCFESKPHSNLERVSRFPFLLIFLAKTANPDITIHKIEISLKQTNGTTTNYLYRTKVLSDWKSACVNNPNTPSKTNRVKKLIKRSEELLFLGRNQMYYYTTTSR